MQGISRPGGVLVVSQEELGCMEVCGWLGSKVERQNKHVVSIVNCELWSYSVCYCHDKMYSKN